MTPMSEPSTAQQHVDLYRLALFGVPETFIRHLALDDPLLVKGDGTATQLVSGHSTYFRISEPHTAKECPHSTVSYGWPVVGS